MTGTTLMFFNSCTSFVGVAGAGFLNAFLMRKTELEKGIDIFDENGKVLGKSKLAAEQAVLQTAVSRVGMAAPLIMPSTVMCLMSMIRIYPKNSVLQSLVVTSLLIAQLYLAVPAGVAMFPNQAELNTVELEKEFQNLERSKGEYFRKVYYNRGM